MRVTVCENTETGTRHGARYRRYAYLLVGQRYACGLRRRYKCIRAWVTTPGFHRVLGHYTDWRDRVTCKTCLRVLARMEEAAKNDG